MPGTAAGTAPTLGQPRGGLGSLARPGGLGSAPKSADDDTPRTLAAPVRAPVQRTGGLGAAAPAADDKPSTGGLGSLKPVRQPITSSIPEATPSESEPMSEEEFDTDPEPIVEEKPSLTQTILDAISEDDSPPAVAPPASASAPPDFAAPPSSRGPPGGGRLIREGAPEKPAKGPPTRGPPELDSETPSEEEEEEEEGVLPTLAPVLRPVLQPTPRKVLTPVDAGDSEGSEGDETTILKPVTRTVLKPATTPPSEEEE